MERPAARTRIIRDAAAALGAVAQHAASLDSVAGGEGTLQVLLAQRVVRVGAVDGRDVRMETAAVRVHQRVGLLLHTAAVD